MRGKQFGFKGGRETFNKYRRERGLIIYNLHSVYTFTQGWVLGEEEREYFLHAKLKKEGKSFERIKIGRL